MPVTVSLEPPRSRRSNNYMNRLCKGVRKPLCCGPRKSPHEKKNATGRLRMSTIMVRALAVALAVSMPLAATAQSAPPPMPQAPAAAPSQQLLTDGQLDALVSPVALYPDALLSEVLMASTYPLEVIEADRWANANKGLNG